MVWLERFVLALLALIFWNWVLNNGLHMDGHFRIALGFILIGVSYGVGHAVYLETRKSVAQPVPTSDAPLPVAPVTIEQKAQDATCSNIVAGKDAKVDCPSEQENGSAKKHPKSP